MASRTIRPVRVEGNIAYVPLTKGYEAIIDAADVPLVEGRNWTAVEKTGAVYAYWQDCSGPKRRTVYLHRVIMGEPAGLEVDHIDGDGLNNLRCNLRVATKSQNMHNAKRPSHNTSGVKGVSWCKRRGNWVARVTLHGKLVWSRHFAQKEDAASAYAEALQRHHGEFARTA